MRGSVGPNDRFWWDAIGLRSLVFNSRACGLKVAFIYKGNLVKILESRQPIATFFYPTQVTPYLCIFIDSFNEHCTIINLYSKMNRHIPIFRYRIENVFGYKIISRHELGFYRKINNSNKRGNYLIVFCLSIYWSLDLHVTLHNKPYSLTVLLWNMFI